MPIKLGYVGLTWTEMKPTSHIFTNLEGENAYRQTDRQTDSLPIMRHF